MPQESVNSDTDRSLLSVTRRIYEAGHDYLFADREDIVNAAKRVYDEEKDDFDKPIDKERDTVCKLPIISGIPVKNIIFPAMDVIWPDVWEALKTLKKCGVNVMFADKIPTERVGDRVRFAWYDFREESVRGPKCRGTEDFKAMSEDEILNTLNSQEKEFQVQADEKDKELMLLKARFVKDGKIIYFVVNNSEADIKLYWAYEGKEMTEVWDPSEGTIEKVGRNELINMVSYRGKFFVFEE